MLCPFYSTSLVASRSCCFCILLLHFVIPSLYSIVPFHLLTCSTMSSGDLSQSNLGLSGQKRDRSPSSNRPNSDARPSQPRVNLPYDPLPHLPPGALLLHPEEARAMGRHSGVSPGDAGGRDSHPEMQRPPRHPNRRRQVGHLPSTATSRAAQDVQRSPSPAARARSPAHAGLDANAATPPRLSCSPSPGPFASVPVSSLLACEDQAAQMELAIESLNTLANMIDAGSCTDNGDDNPELDYDPLKRQTRERIMAPAEVVDRLEQAMRDVNRLVWNNPQMPWTLRRNEPYSEEIRAVLDRVVIQRERYDIFRGMLQGLMQEMQSQGGNRDEAYVERRERIKELRCVIEDEAMFIEEENLLAERSTANSGATSSKSGGSAARHRKVSDVVAAGRSGRTSNQAHASQGRSQQVRRDPDSSRSPHRREISGTRILADVASTVPDTNPSTQRRQRQQRRDP